MKAFVPSFTLENLLSEAGLIPPQSEGVSCLVLEENSFNPKSLDEAIGSLKPRQYLAVCIRLKPDIHPSFLGDISFFLKLPSYYSKICLYSGFFEGRGLKQCSVGLGRDQAAGGNPICFYFLGRKD